MYLGAVKERLDYRIEQADPDALPGRKWQDFPISHLSHHGADCCEVARQWIVAMDFAQLNGGDRLSGPRWLRARYEWGPSSWPIHWCEVVERKVIDCGVHSALAHEAFTGRGVRAFRAQFLQRYGDDACAQWRGRWTSDEASDHWIGDEVIYHEGNALLVAPGEVKLWDSSAGCWLNPRQTKGYGSLAAVRLFVDGLAADEEALDWGGHRIHPNRWVALA
jgi:hypothetical protein